MTLAERKAGLRTCGKCKAYMIASSPQFSVCSNMDCRSKLQSRLSFREKAKLRSYFLIKSGMPEAERVPYPGAMPVRREDCRYGAYKIGKATYYRLQRLDMIDEKLGDVIAIDGHTRGGFRLFNRKEN